LNFMTHYYKWAHHQGSVVVLWKHIINPHKSA
jgi:hypothetical protein